MRLRLKRPSDSLILVAAPFMAVGLVWIKLGAHPWWVGVALRAQIAAWATESRLAPLAGA